MCVKRAVTLLLLVALSALSSSANPGPQAQNGQEILTNADVVKMVRAHLGVDVMLNQINIDAGNYSLSKDDLIRLKQAGVPDKVIAAMQAKGGAAAKANPKQCERISRRWQTEKLPDHPLTGAAKSRIKICLPASSEEIFELSAHCEDTQLLGVTARSAVMDIRSTTPGPGFQRIPGDEQWSRGAQCTWMKVALDNSVVRSVQSIDCENGTVAQLELLYGTVDQLAQKVRGLLPQASPSNNPGVNVLIDMLLNKPIELRTRYFKEHTVLVDDVLPLESMRVELALANGDRPIVTIPIDSTFRDFIHSCASGANSTAASPQPGAAEGMPPAPGAPSASAAGATLIAQQPAVAELESKLSAILRAAASKYGLGPGGYSRELEYINRYLDTCVLSDVPPGTQPPSVNDPRYEICQRQTGKVGFMGSSKDVSMAVNSPHNPFNPKAPGKRDVLLYNGQQANTPWQPGEKNTVTIAIFLPPDGPGILNSSNFDELISNVDVKGRSSPDFASASTTADDSKATVRFYVGTIPDKHTYGVRTAAWVDALGNRHPAQYTPPKVIPVSGDRVKAPHCSEPVEAAASAALQNRMRFAQVEFENETELPLVLQKKGATSSQTNLSPHSKIALSSQSGDVWAVVNQSSQCIINFTSPASTTEWNVVIPAKGLGHKETKSAISSPGFAVSSSPVTNDVQTQAPPLSPSEAADAQVKAASFYYKKQYQDALPLAGEVCASGNQDGCALQGFLYAFGLGVPADPARGKDLMARSCEAGNSIGCDVLGLAYSRGVSVTKDPNKASALFTSSCKGGFYDGCANLATIYLYGIGVHQDSDKALENFDKACTLGHEQFTEACEGGYANACKNLARCYSRGIAAPQDSAKAKELLNQACKMGDRAACSEALNLK